MIKKIGIVTTNPQQFMNYFPTRAEPELIPTEPYFTPDDQLVIDALRAHGYVVNAVMWGEDIQSLLAYDLLIMRSPWDYSHSTKNTSSFIQWLTALQTANITILNPAELMVWLLDKHYLRDLQQTGIAVIPTHYLPAGSSIDLVKHVELHGGFILKPCMSAGGMGLYHIKTMEDARRLQDEVQQKLQYADYMLQDFIPEIQTRGEWSLVFIGGTFSHGLHKMPADQSILVHAERGGSLNFKKLVPEHLIEFAKHAYASILPAFQMATGLQCHANDLLYMRIDLIDAASGPLLIECEGVEPELFFRAKPESVMQFLKAISLCA